MKHWLNRNVWKSRSIQDADGTVPPYFLFIHSWWTCSSATATSDGTFCCSTSSSSSTWRVKSSSKGLSCNLNDFVKGKKKHCGLQVGFLFSVYVSSHSSSCVLNDDQTAWIEETTKLVYQVSLIAGHHTGRYLPLVLFASHWPVLICD